MMAAEVEDRLRRLLAEVYLLLQRAARREGRVGMKEHAIGFYLPDRLECDIEQEVRDIVAPHAITFPSDEYIRSLIQAAREREPALASGAIVSLVMREAGGKANPQHVIRVLGELDEERK